MLVVGPLSSKVGNIHLIPLWQEERLTPTEQHLICGSGEISKEDKCYTVHFYPDSSTSESTLF